MTPPVVAIAGYSNSGKTRVAAALVEDLTRQGYRVAAVKHCHDVHSLDRIDSDTDCLYKADAVSVIASSSGRITSIKRVTGDYSLERIIEGFRAEVDIVIAEGFKDSVAPKVLVVGNESPPEVENLIARVSDDTCERDPSTYEFNALDQLANQIREHFLNPA